MKIDLVTLALILLLVFIAHPCFAQSYLSKGKGIIGLLQLPEVYGEGPCQKYDAKTLKLFDKPKQTEPRGKLYVSKPWVFHVNGGCEGLEVSYLYEESKGQLPTFEYSYESPAAIVTQRKANWFKINLGKDEAWLKLPKERFLPINKLLSENLAYIRVSTDSLLERAGNSKQFLDKNHAKQNNSTTEAPAKILATKRINNELWLHLEIPTINPCTDEVIQKTPKRGWLPFFDKDNIPTVWFYSRGC